MAKAIKAAADLEAMAAANRKEAAEIDAAVAAIKRRVDLLAGVKPDPFAGIGEDADGLDMPRWTIGR